MARFEYKNATAGQNINTALEPATGKAAGIVKKFSWKVFKGLF